MGCGKSKHAVATENTISQSKRSNSKKNVEQKTNLGDVVQSNTQEEIGNTFAKTGTGNSIVEESGNAVKVSADGNGKEVQKVDQVLQKQGDQNPKLEKNVKESHDQPKGESVVENVKEDGNKEAAAAAAEAVVAGAKQGEDKKEVKEEISIKSTEEGGPKEQEEAKKAGPDEAKIGAPEQETASNKVVQEKESEKEIKTQAKNDEALEGQKETGDEETVQSAEAKDSATTAEEKIPSAKEEIESESSEKDQKAN